MSKQSDDSSSGGLSDLLGGITGGGEDAGLDDLVGLAKKLF
ncbi:MAG: hypothetical protein ACR2QL_13775 [Woeseiaceae bacterium]